MYSSRTVQSIYTDGACTGNPGPGGWGVVVYFSDGSIYEMGNSEGHTTNNKMEMQAALAALKLIKTLNQQEPVIIYTDSEYVINGITKWVKGWKKKGWKTSTGTPVLNKDLWEKLDESNSRLVKWQHVRGHVGIVGNERADAIARAYAAGKTPSLQQTPVDVAVVTGETDRSEMPSGTLRERQTLQSSNLSSDPPTLDFVMVDSTASITTDTLDNIPREARVVQLRNLIETMRVADEIAAKGYFITSSELADLMDVNASAVTSRGDEWRWRNWIVSRVKREGNQILWQLERWDLQVNPDESDNSDHATE